MNALLISDRAELRGPLKSRLEQAGFQTAVCGYTTAVAACDSAEWPALVVLDSVGHEPWELCRRIRARPGGNLALIWVAVDQNDSQSQRAALEVGADECLPVPSESSWLELHLAAAARQITALQEVPRARAALAETMERWALVERGARGGVWDVGPIGEQLDAPDTPVWYSDGMKRLLGLSDEDFPNVLASWMARVHPDELQPVVATIKRCLEEKSQFEIEYRLLTKHQGYRWFNSRGQAILDSEGRIVRVAGTVRDITENRRAAEALQASEAKWRSLVESAPDTIIVVDPDGTIRFMNRDWPGVADERSLGSNLVSLVPPDRRVSLRTVLQQAAQTGQPARFEITLPGTDGRLVWFASRVSPIHSSDGISALVIITTDITFRRRAEEEREQFVATIENSSDFIGMVGESGTLLHLNPAGCKLVGLKDQESAKTISFAELYAEGFRERYANEILPAVHAEGRWAGEVQLRDLRTGHTIDVHQKIFLIRSSRSGVRPCLATISRDIRAKKRQESALRREQEFLRKLLALHERERQLVAYEIHDGLAQQMTAALMHLQAFQHIAAERLESTDFERGLGLLREAMQEARRLISGLRPPVLDEMGIVAAIEYLVNEMQPDVPNIKFIHHTKFVRLAPPLESAIFRIVQEALSNIRAHSGSRRAKIELIEHGRQLRLVVRDWGKGFDPANVSEGRFGLQGIRQRGRLLGATVVIESQPGEGTTVVVDFPLILNRNGDGPEHGTEAK